ncbi:Interferon- developmental regulator 1 [Actinomortierella ambigua]|nr:Interferon- developmental regulator 1 [Actinomortierella ambigua]
MSNLRKTASRNSTKKLGQQLAQLNLGVPSGGSRSGSRAGSRAGSRLASQVNSDAEDDLQSETSAADRDDDDWGAGGGGFYREARETSLESLIKEAIEELGEKRASTREEALSKLSTYMTQRYAAEALDSERDDLIDLLKKSIKRGGARECVAAAGVMALVFITIGEDDEKMFTDLAPLLKYTIINHDQTEAKVALLNFFADVAVTAGESVNAHQNGDTLAAALEAFSVLYAGLFGHGLGHSRPLMMQARRIFNKIIDPLELLLDHSTMEVRVASGEAIALLFEILNHYQQQRDEGEISEDDDDDYEEQEQQQQQQHTHEEVHGSHSEGNGHGEANSNRRSGGRASETYADDEEDEDYNEVTGDFRFGGLNQIVATLASLSTDSSRHRSKKERSAGRSAFRDILKSVESGERPRESLRLKDYDISFRGWVEILQLHFLRDRLTSGLQTHFVHNPTIHGILPSTAVLYSPGSGGEGGGSFDGGGLARFNGGGGGGGGSRMGSQAGSRAGSRPSSSMGHYADAEDLKEEQAVNKVDRKYLNAEMARMRQMQRKRDRGRDKYGDDY